MSVIAMIKRLMSFRFLLRQTVVREIRVRYKQTVIGLLWAVLQPLIFSAIFVTIFKVFRGDLASGEHFSQLFVMMSLWTFAGNSVALATSSIVNHPGLVTKIAFPREIFPISFVTVGTLDLIFNLAVGSVLVFWSGLHFGIQEVGAFALLILCLFIYIFSLSILFAGLNVLYRDFKYIVPIAVQIMFFGTPIIYSVNDLSSRAAMFVSWNPLTPIFETLRAILMESPIPWQGLSCTFLVSIVLCEIVLKIFNHVNERMADVI